MRVLFSYDGGRRVKKCDGKARGCLKKGKFKIIVIVSRVQERIPTNFNPKIFKVMNIDPKSKLGRRTAEIARIGLSHGKTLCGNLRCDNRLKEENLGFLKSRFKVTNFGFG
ncbi:MAG: hypothetical protein NTX55_02810 [Candidatus Parcubacteria bacterium]|nr:hypothetical protein [Candidatus Parcubacteria bacterium]